MVKQRIKNKLNNILETIDNMKDELKCGSYLKKMNDLKAISDFVEIIEQADN